MDRVVGSVKWLLNVPIINEARKWGLRFVYGIK
jgi:hypothetical protein